jgi:glycosyltransferase involved in cell wall biosynthesis
MSTETWLFVNGAPAFGGHETMMLRLIDELEEQSRVKPVLLARGGTRLRERAKRYVTSRLLAPIDSAPNGSKIVRALVRNTRDAWTFIRTVGTLKPGLCIVTEGCILAQPIFTAMARLLGLRVVVYTPLVERSTDMGFSRGALRDWLVRHVYGNLPHGWITITAEQARVLAAWAGVRRPILTLPNVVDRSLEHGYIAAAVPSLGPMRVLVLGRLDAHQKGLDLLLDFIERSVDCVPEFGREYHISIVGDGDYRNEILRRLAARPALAEVVTLVPWADASAVMRRHDVLLLPSRFEGVPLVMLEAMAVGLPVVASKLAGTRAYLAPEWLFDVGDLATAFKLIALLKVYAIRAAAVADNYEAFQQGASHDAFSRSVRTLTDELLQLAGAA